MSLLAQNLKYLRKKHHFTQQEIANKLGLKDHSTIGKWENGTNEPTVSTVTELSKIYNVNIDHLVNVDLTTNEQQSDVSFPTEYPSVFTQTDISLAKQYLNEMFSAHNLNFFKGSKPVDEMVDEEVLESANMLMQQVGIVAKIINKKERE